VSLKTKLKNFFALERNIIVIIIANTLWSTMVLYRGFLPKFYESLGATIFFVGLLFSLSDLFYSLSSFIGGHLSDAYGRKQIFVRTALIGHFLLLGYLFAPNWIFLIPFLILGNFVSGMGDASAQTMISESVPKKSRATGLASIYLTATIVSALIVPCGALLVQNYGMLDGVRAAILISFFFSLTGTIILFFYGKETLKRKLKKKIKFKLNFSELKEFFKSLPLSIKGMFFFASLLYFSSMLNTPYWIFYSLDVIKINSLEFGILESIQFITVAVFTFVGAKLSDKYGRKKILLLSIILSLIVPILFIFSKNFIQLIFVYVTGGASAFGFSTVFAYIADNINQKRRSRAIGMTNGLMTFASIPAPLIGSILYSIMPQYPFIFSSVLFAITLIVGMKFLK
jgi:MFS family permease